MRAGRGEPACTAVSAGRFVANTPAGSFAKRSTRPFPNIQPCVRAWNAQLAKLLRQKGRVEVPTLRLAHHSKGKSLPFSFCPLLDFPARTERYVRAGCFFFSSAEQCRSIKKKERDLKKHRT